MRPQPRIEMTIIPKGRIPTNDPTIFSWTYTLPLLPLGNLPKELTPLVAIPGKNQLLPVGLMIIKVVGYDIIVLTCINFTATFIFIFVPHTI